MKNLEALDQEPYLWEYLQTVQKPIVLYGMGNGADAILDRCAQLNIPVAGVFASDEFVRGQEFRGYKVKTYKEMQAEWGSFVILIAFASERPEILRRFFHLAEEQETYAPHLPLFGDTTVVTPSWIRENRGVLERVYGKLADDASRQVMEDILRYKLTGKLDFLSGPRTGGRTWRPFLPLERWKVMGTWAPTMGIPSGNSWNSRGAITTISTQWNRIPKISPSSSTLWKQNSWAAAVCARKESGHRRPSSPLRLGEAGCPLWSRRGKKKCW